MAYQKNKATEKYEKTQLIMKIYYEGNVYRGFFKHVKPLFNEPWGGTYSNGSLLKELPDDGSYLKQLLFEGALTRGGA